MNQFWIGGGAWAAAAAVWLLLMPRETRGKSWHYVLALAPLAVTAGLMAASGSDLGADLAVWWRDGAAILILGAGTWLIGTLLRNHGVMDVAYPLLPVAVAAGVLVQRPAPLDAHAVLLLATLGVWSARLSIQTWGHNMERERQPYAHWRAKFGPRWTWWSLFQVYLLQGVTVWLWCAPLALALLAPQPRAPWWTAFGLIVWGAGFLLQWTADRQLARFRADPGNRGRLLDSGAWALVRHPNYLGESVMWLGWFVFALAHPWGWLTLAAPLFTAWFMGYASAAPFKERHMAASRGQAWAEYCARTPRFLPWPRPGGARS